MDLAEIKTELGFSPRYRWLANIAQDLVAEVERLEAKAQLLEAENAEIFGLRQREQSHARISEERLAEVDRLRALINKERKEFHDIELRLRTALQKHEDGWLEQ